MRRGILKFTPDCRHAIYNFFSVSSITHSHIFKLCRQRNAVTPTSRHDDHTYTRIHRHCAIKVRASCPDLRKALTPFQKPKKREKGLHIKTTPPCDKLQHICVRPRSTGSPQCAGDWPHKKDRTKSERKRERIAQEQPYPRRDQLQFIFLRKKHTKKMKYDRIGTLVGPATPPLRVLSSGSK